MSEAGSSMADPPEASLYAVMMACQHPGAPSSWLHPSFPCWRPLFVALPFCCVVLPACRHATTSDASRVPADGIAPTCLHAGMTTAPCSDDALLLDLSCCHAGMFSCWHLVLLPRRFASPSRLRRPCVEGCSQGRRSKRNCPLSKSRMSRSDERMARRMESTPSQVITPKTTHVAVSKRAAFCLSRPI